MAGMVLPELFGTHMMLQREKPIRFEVSVSGTSMFEVLLGKRNADGSFDVVRSGSFPSDGGTCHVCLEGIGAGTGYVLRLLPDGREEEALELDDINIGDIWMACGQSNMEYFLRYDADWSRTRKLARNPLIRMFNVPRIAFEGQEKEQPECGYWFEEGDEAWGLFSAPGYSFARTVQQKTGIPVGVVGCNWGGTPACAWMPESYFAEEPLHVFVEDYERETAPYTYEQLREMSRKALAFESTFRHQVEWHAVMHGLTEKEQERFVQEHADDPVLPMGPWHHYRPGGLYETMIRKAAPFPVKGFLWYQGESDTGHADIYDRTMEALLRCFRDTWQDEDLPFLYVQLAPFGHWLECTNDHYADLRAAQERASKQLSKAWMASIMDLGSYEDIHPKLKMEVGRRLALLALGHVYGQDVLCDPPEAESVSLQVLPGEESRAVAVVRFAHAGDGLYSDGAPAQGFAFSAGGCSLPVLSCSLEGDAVKLTVDLSGLDAGVMDTPETDAGKAGMAAGAAGGRLPGMEVCVAYADEDYCETHLWSSAGLSAKPFRTCVKIS